MTENELYTLLVGKKIRTKSNAKGYYVIVDVHYANRELVALELKDEDTTIKVESCFKIDDLAKIQEKIIE